MSNKPFGRILIIKLGALGDFVLATGPFSAIRKAHQKANIILLTTSPFVELARESGFFDEVWIDERPSRIDLFGIQRLRKKLRDGQFNFVYDLQTSRRSGWYYRFFGDENRPQWCGIVKGCSHPHLNPNRNKMHTIERQAEQLTLTGILDTPLPDLSWLKPKLKKFTLPEKFVLLVPGAAGHRPLKRWPPENYKKLVGLLSNKGFKTVVIGGKDELGLANKIVAGTNAVSLVGKTTIAELAGLSRRAHGAVGNDTGPMHIAAVCGCPSTVLFSTVSNPQITAPRGPNVVILQRTNLVDLTVGEVADTLRLR